MFLRYFYIYLLYSAYYFLAYDFTSFVLFDFPEPLKLRLGLRALLVISIDLINS
jgi:hypothetical protein